MNLRKTAVKYLPITLLCTVSCSQPNAQQEGLYRDDPQAIHILPLGDSITQADAQHQSYRFWLWQSLREKNLAADFVGSQDSNHDGTPDYPAEFDKNHEGHWGWRTDEVLSQLPNWLAQYPVDIALVHLGTNDCLQNQANDQTEHELGQIIEKLRTKNPTVHVLFAPLGPTTWPAQPCLSDLNLRLQALSERSDQPDSRVLVAEQSEKLVPNQHFYDGLHPNAKGERLLAAMWLESIETLIEQ